MIRQEYQPILAVDVNRILFVSIAGELMPALRRPNWHL